MPRRGGPRPGRRGRPRREVVVYTREGCGLCVVAEQLVAREARGHHVRHVDVDRDPQLQRRYGVRVPVVTVDDVEVAELQVSPGEVRDGLARFGDAGRPR